MVKGQRLDARVVELGLFPTRQAAQAAIMDGGILVDGLPVTKAGTAVSDSASIEIAGGYGRPKYVSRGGLKLEKALDEFAVSVEGRVCIDIGASTGGFTDCLIQRGAERVYAVDVGYGQIDWSLRQHPRVVVRERLNARHLEPDSLYEPGARRAGLAVGDVSFISLLKILPACLRVLDPEESEIIFLIKPQFEAGRSAVGKGGVVRDPAVHLEVLTSILGQTATIGLYAHALSFSPLKGPAGNIEYLALWRLLPPQVSPDARATVEEAHRSLAPTP